ncbi:MAG: ribokinase [Burkholderiaceae bacterium]
MLGSLNMDVVVRVSRAPAGGETIEGRSVAYLPGGKGGNQAVSCARQGASVHLIGQVGDDPHGVALCAALSQDGIRHGDVCVDPVEATGVAVVVVDDQAQNRIVVVPGANGRLNPDPSMLAARLQDAQWLVMQLEVPLAAVLMAAEQAKVNACRVVLNPSPSQNLPDSLWAWVDTVVLNESEAQALTQMAVPSPLEAAMASQWFLSHGVRQVVVTLGAQGAVATDAHGSRFHPALAVDAVDTTAAGDTFLGALVVSLARGDTLDEGVSMGLRAASLCVQTVGAQPSIPSRAAVLKTPLAPPWKSL